MGAKDSEEEFYSRSFLNLITDVLYMVVSALIGFMMVPYYLNELGVAAYAMIPLATSLSAYALIISDSVCGSVNRYVVVALQSGDKDEINRVYNTAMFTMIGVVLIMAPIMALVGYLSPLFFNTSSVYDFEVRVMFIGVMWAMLIFTLGTFFIYVEAAKNNLYSVNILRVFYLVAQVALVMMMFQGRVPDLSLVGISYLGAAVSYLILAVVFSRKSFPEISISASYYDKELRHDILGLSVWGIVSKVGSLMFIQASLIMTNLLLGEVLEGYFSLIVSMVSMIFTVSYALGSLYSPLFYHEYVNERMDDLARYAKVGVKFIGALIAIPIAYLCIFFPEIMNVWVHMESEELNDIVWLMFAFMPIFGALTVLDPIQTLVLKLRSVSIITLAIGVLNIILAVVLVCLTDWGLLAIAIAWLISMFIRNVLYYMPFNARIIGKRDGFFVPSFISIMLIFVISSALFAVVRSFFYTPTGLISLLLLFLPMFLLLVAISFRILYDKEELSLLRGMLPAFMKKLLPI
ncbi:MAG: hypothetical protein ACI4Q9_00800 [Candidatus Methanomethylophilaceae archaeon]